jgi:hypothetical protein
MRIASVKGTQFGVARLSNRNAKIAKQGVTIAPSDIAGVRLMTDGRYRSTIWLAA